MSKKQKQFLETLEACHGNLYRACQNFGISRQAVYKWISGNGKFAAEVEAIRQNTADFVEWKLMEHIDKGNLDAIKFYLSRRAGWTEKQDGEAGQADGGLMQWVLMPVSSPGEG